MIRSTALLLLVGALSLPVRAPSAAAQDSPKKNLPVIATEEFASRRAKLAEKLGPGIVVMDAGVMIPGAGGIAANTPTMDFFYLTGMHDDQGVLVIADRKTFLFVTGDLAAVKKRTGVENVLAREKFEAFAKEVLGGAPTIYTKVRKATKDLLASAAPKAKLQGSVGGALTALRVVKTDAELAMMRKAADATNRAHFAAMHACAPGMNEGELQKIIEATFKAEDCDGLSFPSIIGSGKNGTILHYMENKAEMPANSLVVCDIGASYRGYATDITRTLPTSGKFTDEEREAYQCVLDAQKAAEAVCKPGATFRELEGAARKVFKDRNLTDWSYCYSKDMSVLHGLGHYVGLAVHDSGTYAEKFAPGMVITIEPGYYNREKEWGIRIEDIYIITKDGFERMSQSPREPDEIEKEMAKREKK